MQMNCMQSIPMLFIAVSTAACGDNVKLYQKSDVEIVESFKSADLTIIVYRPVLESMYYCPGINTKIFESRTKVSFVRCAISAKCQVDIVAKDLGQDRLQVAISDAPDKIDLIYKDGEIALSALKK